MPNLPISQLPQSTALQGDELFVDVQNGVTKYTTLDNLVGYASGSLVESAYISCYSEETQNLITPGVGQPATFTSTWVSKDINLVDQSKLVFVKKGTYKLNFIAQLGNSDNAVHDSYFWIKYNGNDFPFSTTRMTLQPRKNSSEPSGQLMTVAIVGVAQNDGDYIELYWTGDSTLNQLTYTDPVGQIPASPSIIASVVKVG